MDLVEINSNRNLSQLTFLGNGLPSPESAIPHPSAMKRSRSMPPIRERTLVRGGNVTAARPGKIAAFQLQGN